MVKKFFFPTVATVASKILNYASNTPDAAHEVAQKTNPQRIPVLHTQNFLLQLQCLNMSDAQSFTVETIT